MHIFRNIIANQEMSITMSIWNEHHVIPTHTSLQKDFWMGTFHRETARETIWNIENKEK